MPEVIVIGGSVAGASAALLLGRSGVGVEIYEQSLTPREKACGEGLMPAGAAALARLGVDVEARQLEGIRYIRNGRRIEARFENGSGLGVRRLTLDAALIGAASRVAHVHRGARVEAPLLENGRVTGVFVDGSPRRANLVVAADGVHSLFRCKLGLREEHGARRVGASAHFRLQTDSFVEVHWHKSHEIYVTPLAGGEALVAILGDRWETAAATLPQAGQLTPWRGAAHWNVEVPVRHGPGFVLLGDAAGYIDPITGGGMTQALLSAELLAQHWRDLDEFDRSRERMLADYRRLTRFALWTSAYPYAARVCFDFLRLAPWTFHHLVAVAGGERRLW